MKSGDRVILKMQKALRTDMVMDEKPYLCKVLRYDENLECIYLVLENDFLPIISLDVLYECSVLGKENEILCTGRVKERFQNEYGNIIKFEIKNGFYKITLNSVDKQEA